MGNAANQDTPQSLHQPVSTRHVRVTSSSSSLPPPFSPPMSHPHPLLPLFSPLSNVYSSAKSQRRKWEGGRAPSFQSSPRIGNLSRIPEKTPFVLPASWARILQIASLEILLWEKEIFLFGTREKTPSNCSPDDWKLSSRTDRPPNAKKKPKLRKEVKEIKGGRSALSLERRTEPRVAAERGGGRMNGRVRRRGVGGRGKEERRNAFLCPFPFASSLL